MLLSRHVGVLACFSETGSTSCKNFFFLTRVQVALPTSWSRFGRKFCDLPYTWVYTVLMLMLYFASMVLQLVLIFWNIRHSREKLFCVYLRGMLLFCQLSQSYCCYVFYISSEKNLCFRFILIFFEAFLPVSVNGKIGKIRTSLVSLFIRIIVAKVCYSVHVLLPLN